MTIIYLNSYYFHSYLSASTGFLVAAFLPIESGLPALFYFYSYLKLSTGFLVAAL
jgi:hypothetical protein